MRRTMATLAVAVALVGAGCEDGEGKVLDAAPEPSTAPAAEPSAVDSSPAPTTAPPTTEPPTTAAPTTTVYELKPADLEALFLVVVRANTDNFDGAGDAELVALGHKVCEVIDEAGGDVQAGMRQLALALVSQGSDYLAEDAGTIFGAAIPAFCPRYEGQIE